MGLLVEGQWHDAWYDTKSTRGRFVRKQVFHALHALCRWLFPISRSASYPLADHIGLKRNVARSAIVVGVVCVVVRPAVGRAYQTKSNGRGRICRSLGVVYLTAMMDSVLMMVVMVVMVVMEASCPCWDAGKDFGRDRGTRDAKDN